MAKPDLIIDSNERGTLCESVERRAEKAGMTVARQVLVVGDYQLGGACVEAKSISDLFQSSHNGHLWRQLDNMDANYERFFLLVHGSIEKHVSIMKSKGSKNVTYSRVQSELIGTIARIMSDFNCQVFYTPHVSEAAMFVVKLHDKLHKPASKHGAQAVRRVASNDIRMDVLMAIPSVGREIAERLLEKCGSIEEMAFPESLKQVKGLGEARRKLLMKVLTSEEEVRQERKVRR
jgi:ERCC4-type nuclease